MFDENSHSFVYVRSVCYSRLNANACSSEAVVISLQFSCFSLDYSY